MTEQVKQETISFDEEFTRLSDLVSELENPEIGLEESLQKFKTGVELAKNLKRRLAEMENEIEELTVELSQREPTS